MTFDLFQFLALKEINRGNDLEAISFYYRFTLNPLVEVLRIKHSPARYNFHTRHIHYDLPQELISDLRELFFVSDLDDLDAKRERAERWFYEIHNELNEVSSVG
jgi:hypothetical protein